MGAMLGCLATEAACCFTSATCKCLGKALSTSTVTRVSYAVLFLINTVIAWALLSDFFSRQLEHWTYGYLKLSCEDGGCYGVLAVQRMCFAMTVFHFILGSLLVGVQDSTEARAGIQNGWWLPKVLVWLGLVVISFFIPNEFFMFWGHYIALIGAAIFIILQIILLIDFAHKFSEALLERYEASESRMWLTILISSAMTLLILAIVMMGLMYAFFAGAECNLNRFFITFNLILSVACVIFSLAPQVQEANSQSGLMQPSIIAAYATYLILSAVANEPESTCNPMYAHKGTQTLTVFIGTIFTFVAITYSTSSAAVKAKNLVIESSETTPLISEQPRRRQALLSAVEQGALPQSALTEFDADQERLGDMNDEVDGVQYNYSFFHLIFAMAAMYVAMLLTNWNVVTSIGQAADPGQGALVEIGKSWAAVWVKVVSSWLVVILYSWTLWAPVWFPERDWSA